MNKIAIAMLLLAPGDALEYVSWTDPITWNSYIEAAGDLGLWCKGDPYLGELAPNFVGEIRWAKWALAEVEKCPPAEDLVRFPSLETIKACIAFNEAYQEKIQAQYRIYPAAEYPKILEECHWRHNYWTYLQKIHEMRTPYGRRRQLEQLRSCIGYEAYYAGRMPDHVPLWGFRFKDD